MYDIALATVWLKDLYLCARVISRAHRYDLYAQQNRVHYLPFRRLLLSRLSAILPCSKDGKKYIDSTWPGFESKVSTSYLGTRDMPNKSEENSETPLRLVFCSRVVEVKRVPLLAKAISLLDREGLCVEWTHFGDGPQIDEAKAACSNLKDSTVRFEGSVPNNMLLNEYGSRHFDLLINVSTSEGLPLSIMEACGCGIPVIATDVGGIREIVIEGVNGFLLSGDCAVEDVASAIVRFNSLDEGENHRMRRASRAIWEKRFRIETNVKGLIRVLGINSGIEGE